MLQKKEVVLANITYNCEYKVDNKQVTIISILIHQGKKIISLNPLMCHQNVLNKLKIACAE